MPLPDWMEAHSAKLAEQDRREEVHARHAEAVRGHDAARRGLVYLTKLEIGLVGELARLRRHPLLPEHCMRVVSDRGIGFEVIDEARVDLCAATIALLGAWHAADKPKTDLRTWFIRQAWPALSALPPDLLPREGSRYEELKKIYAYLAAPFPPSGTAARPPMPDETTR